MKQLFSLYRRNGIYYAQNTQNGKQESLRTRDEAAAKALLHSKNEASRQPILNRQIALAYLSATDAAAATRTWKFVMDEMAVGPIPQRDHVPFVPPKHRRVVHSDQSWTFTRHAYPTAAMEGALPLFQIQPPPYRPWSESCDQTERIPAQAVTSRLRGNRKMTHRACTRHWRPAQFGEQRQTNPGSPAASAQPRCLPTREEDRHMHTHMPCRLGSTGRWNRDGTFQLYWKVLSVHILAKEKRLYALQRDHTLGDVPDGVGQVLKREPQQHHHGDRGERLTGFHWRCHHYGVHRERRKRPVAEVAQQVSHSAPGVRRTIQRRPVHSHHHRHGPAQRRLNGVCPRCTHERLHLPFAMLADHDGKRLLPRVQFNELDTRQDLVHGARAN